MKRITSTKSRPVRSSLGLSNLEVKLIESALYHWCPDDEDEAWDQFRLWQRLRRLVPFQSWLRTPGALIPDAAAAEDRTSMLEHELGAGMKDLDAVDRAVIGRLFLAGLER